jgi:hypothetical protein
MNMTAAHLFPESERPDSSIVLPQFSINVTQDRTNISFTFFQSGAGNANIFGYGIYDPVAHTVGSSSQAAFPRLNQAMATPPRGCLTQGDTFTFGPFNAGQQIILYLSYPSFQFWSYVDYDFQGSDKVECPPYGCAHFAAAYDSITGFTYVGIEDSSLGDADYNDAVVLLKYQGGAQANSNLPLISGTSFVTCNSSTQILVSSTFTMGCVEYGLMETTGLGCSAYDAIPSGEWTWIHDNDPNLLPAMSQFGSTPWSGECIGAYHNSTHSSGWSCDTGISCFLIPYNSTTAYPSGASCMNFGCGDERVLLLHRPISGCTPPSPPVQPTPVSSPLTPPETAPSPVMVPVNSPVTTAPENIPITTPESPVASPMGSPTSPPVEQQTSDCPGSPPSSQFSCENGVWVAEGSVEVDSDLIIPAGASLHVNGNFASRAAVNMRGQTSTIVASGCISFSASGVTLELDEVPKSSGARDSPVAIQNSSCVSSLLETPVDVRTPSSCAKTSVSTEKEGIPPSQLSVVFNVSRSPCNTQWIIMGSIFAFVAVLAIVVALVLVFTYNKTCRQAARPFANS